MTNQDAVDRAIRSANASMEIEGLKLGKAAAVYGRQFLEGKITREQALESIKKEVEIDIEKNK